MQTFIKEVQKFCERMQKHWNVSHHVPLVFNLIHCIEIVAHLKV